MLPGSFKGLGSRIAVTGGAGNPVHSLHVRMVLALLNAKDENMAPLYDSVLWVLSGTSNFKPELLPGIHRQQMAILAFPDQWLYRQTRWGRFYLDVSNAMYQNVPTVDLLARVKADNPESEVIFVIGSDAVTPVAGSDSKEKIYPIQSWVGFEQLFNHSDPQQFVVIPRQGYLTPDEGSLPFSNMSWFGDEVFPAVSSTQIRELIAKGDGEWRKYVPTRVAEYIRLHRLYSQK